jgi:hypothetical protein
VHDRIVHDLSDRNHLAGLHAKNHEFGEASLRKTAKPAAQNIMSHAVAAKTAALNASFGSGLPRTMPLSTTHRDPDLPREEVLLHS